jgi:hypothetical protein
VINKQLLHLTWERITGAAMGRHSDTFERVLGAFTEFTDHLNKAGSPQHLQFEVSLMKVRLVLQGAPSHGT